jgi:hypothetical protein
VLVVFSLGFEEESLIPVIAHALKLAHRLVARFKKHGPAFTSQLSDRGIIDGLHGGNKIGAADAIGHLQVAQVLSLIAR